MIKTIGKKFGKLTAISFSHKTGNAYYYLCRCDCGNTKIFQINNLRSGNTKSCGCISKEHPNSVIHGLKHHPVYSLYSKIIERCYNPNVRSYPLYGGRGISVGFEWKRNPVAFIKWALANGWEKGKQIDRINNNGNYQPDNCRFVTPKENCRNRRTTLQITFKGKTRSLIEWCELLNIKYPRTYYRLVIQKLPFNKAFSKQPLI